MGSLYQIVYTSTAADSFGRAELMELLKGSVQRNTRTGITGLLLYQDGTFMQVLEGEEATVILLFAKISRDPRHHHVIPLIHEPIERRSFSNSAMAFRDLDASELRNLPGYSEFLNMPLNGDLLVKDIPKCQRLCSCFSGRTFTEAKVHKQPQVCLIRPFRRQECWDVSSVEDYRRRRGLLK